MEGKGQGGPQRESENERMSDTQTHFEYLTSMVDTDRDSVDTKTQEGKIKAKAVMAQTTYKKRREQMVQHLLDGKEVAWMIGWEQELVVQAEAEAMFWTVAVENGPVAAAHRAAQHLRIERSSSSQMCNARDGMVREAARSFLSDLTYSLTDAGTENEIEMEIARQFLR